MPDSAKPELKITTKKEKMLTLLLVVIGLIFFIFIISSIVVNLSPTAMFFIFMIAFAGGFYALTQKIKKRKNLKQIIYEVADALYELDDSLGGIDTRPWKNEVFPIGKSEYLVYVGSLGMTFLYDEKANLFGSRLIPLYSVREEMETSGLFKELRARQKAEAQLNELKEKLGIEIEGGGKVE